MASDVKVIIGMNGRNYPPDQPVIVDSEFSEDSKNPVENRVVAKAIRELTESSIIIDLTNCAYTTTTINGIYDQISEALLNDQLILGKGLVNSNILHMKTLTPLSFSKIDTYNEETQSNEWWLVAAYEVVFEDVGHIHCWGHMYIKIKPNDTVEIDYLDE